MPKAIYMCVHCGYKDRGYVNSDVSKVEKHEKSCEYNPVNKKCASCYRGYNKYSDFACSRIRNEDKFLTCDCCEDYMLDKRYNKQ